MNVGMFGQNDFYFFYMEFKPTTSYVLDTEYFECWFQMGDTESDWEGVTFTATADLAQGSIYPMTQVSATNTDFVDKDSSAYGDDTFFFGQIDYSGTDAWVQIIRQTPRSEQSDEDGTVTRIEWGRELIMEFIDGTGTSVTQTFTLDAAL